MSGSGLGMRTLTVGGLFVIAMLAAAPPALALCANPNDPLQATLKFKDAPASVTFAATTPIRIVLQIENCSGDRVLTTDKFSSTDFFRRLYFTDPDGGTIVNKAEETLHAFSETFFCHSRNGVLQSTTIPVVPVEVLAGPQGEPAVPHFFREFVIDPRTLYDLTLPGHYSVNARIELLTFQASSPTAVFGDCDQLPGRTVVNVGAVSGRQGFTIVSNTLELVIQAPGAANSSITGTSPVQANGIAASTVTITLQDASGAPMPGVTPTFSATGSNNALGNCSASNASGVSTCSLRSTTAEVKTLAIVTPVAKTGGTVSFVAGCPADPNAAMTRAVDPSGTNHGVPTYTKLQAAYNDAADCGNEVIGLFGNLTENVVLGGSKTLTIKQNGVSQITAADSSKPVVDITSAGNLTIVGPGAVGGAVGWRVGGNGGHALKSVRASGAGQYGIQILSNGNSVEGASVQQNGRHGVFVSGSANTISGSTAQSNGQSGFNVTGGTNLLDASTATSNTGDGFKVDGSGNTIKGGSIAQSNGQSGFNVTGGTNLLDANAASNNTGNGFKISGAGNTLRSNAAQSNGQDGFNSASSGSNTRFDFNTANRNTGDGFEINGAGSTLTSNQSNTGAPGGTNENSGAEYRLNVAVTDGGGNKADSIGIPKTSAPQKCAFFPAKGVCE